jgi:hypothetical protein
MKRYSLRSPAPHRPDVSLSRALPLAFASSSIPPTDGHAVGTCSERLGAESHQRVTPFPLSIARTLRVTLSTGFGDGAHGSVRWLPASYPVPFGSSVSASCAGSLSRWLNHVFAYATHRFLLDGDSGLRLPDTAVYPRCSLLRTSRETGGYACTSAPEGWGLHPHGDGVIRPCGLTACLEVRTSFQPTGRRPDLVVDHWTSGVESSSPLDFLLLHAVWAPFGRLMSHKIMSIISASCDFTTKSGGI